MKKEYKVIYDKHNPNYAGNYDYDLHYLANQLTFMGDLYKARGYLFLRDIYEYLGIPVTRDILGIGWYKDSNDKTDYYTRINHTEDGAFVITFYTHGNIMKCFK